MNRLFFIIGRLKLRMGFPAMALRAKVMQSEKSSALDANKRMAYSTILGSLTLISLNTESSTVPIIERGTRYTSRKVIAQRARYSGYVRAFPDAIIERALREFTLSSFNG